MENFVSTRWIGVAALVASLSVAWAIFIPYRFPWMGLGLVSLACLGALWLRVGAPRSMTQVIDGVEAEPARALVGPEPVAVTVPNAVP